MSQSRPSKYMQPYHAQSHYNSAYSDGQIYDQPPSPSIENAKSAANFAMNGNQCLYEGLMLRMVPPIPPATAPASRRRFGRRSDYESEEVNTNEDLNNDNDDDDGGETDNGRGGTLSRRRPVPPMGVLINQYSRESLNHVSILTVLLIFLIEQYFAVALPRI